MSSTVCIHRYEVGCECCGVLSSESKKWLAESAALGYSLKHDGAYYFDRMARHHQRNFVKFNAAQDVVAVGFKP